MVTRPRPQGNRSGRKRIDASQSRYNTPHNLRVSAKSISLSPDNIIKIEAARRPPIHHSGRSCFWPSARRPRISLPLRGCPENAPGAAATHYSRRGKLSFCRPSFHHSLITWLYLSAPKKLPPGAKDSLSPPPSCGPAGPYTVRALSRIASSCPRVAIVLSIPVFDKGCGVVPSDAAQA